MVTRLAEVKMLPVEALVVALAAWVAASQPIKDSKKGVWWTLMSLA